MTKNLILLLAVIIQIIILFYTPSINSDLGYYFDLSKKMVSGLLPYLDFKFEYPPLAILPIWIPGIFKSEIKGYNFLFRAIFCLFNILFLLFISHRLTNHLIYNFFYKRYLIFYTLLSVLMAPLFYDRLDLLFGFILFGSLYYSNEKSLFWTLLGIPYKLISAIFLPFYGLAFLRSRNLNLKDLFKLCVLPIGGLLAVILYMFQFKFLSFLSYHHLRGIQIESTWATLHFLMQLFNDQKMIIEYSFGAQHLKDVSGWIVFLANYSLVGFLSLLFIIYYFKKNPLPEIFITALLVFICFSKVLSPQYFIWLIPLLIFFIEENIELALFLLIAAISNYVFIHYGELMAQASWAWWCISLRNVALVCWVMMRFKNHLKFV
jgi:hypothetical protein